MTSTPDDVIHIFTFMKLEEAKKEHEEENWIPY
jgi:hypothetical protein